MSMTEEILVCVLSNELVGCGGMIEFLEQDVTR
jgi:hypothetical protein